MKIQDSVVHVICFASFLYFFIPVSMEYFNYATITTSFMPHFHRNFPKPKLFFSSVSSQYNVSTLDEVIKVNDGSANVTLISSNGTQSLFSITPTELSATVDQHVWFGAVDYDLKSYQLIVKYDGSNDQISEVFRDIQPYFTVSAQIFRKAPPPYGTCRNLNSLTSNSTCINVRYFRFSSREWLPKPTIVVANSLCFLHEPDYKFPLSFFLILILGMIGIFSDITAIDVNQLIRLTSKTSLWNSSNIVKKLVKIPTKFNQILTYLGLFITCTYHVSLITEYYTKYDIQSTVYEGPLTNQFSPFTAKMCVRLEKEPSENLRQIMMKYYKRNYTGKTRNLSESILEFEVNNCKTQKKFTKLDDGTECVELVPVINDISSNYPKYPQYPVYFNWNYTYWNYNEFIRFDLIKIAVYPIGRSSFEHFSTFQIPSYPKINNYRLMYFRGQFLKHPYVTKCNQSPCDEYGNFNRSMLKCTEEAYLEYDRSRTILADHTITVIMTPSNRGFEVNVVPSMTLFDYISCLSTVIGFWIGLSVLGSADLCIDICCSCKKLNLIYKFLVYFLLSVSLVHILYLRFQEYLVYDVSTDMEFHDTPVGMKLPHISFTIRDKVIGQIPNRSEGWYTQSVMDMCNNFSNRIPFSQIFSIINSSGVSAIINTSHIDSVTKCYMIERSEAVISIDVGTLIGTWEPRKHKYITVMPSLPNPNNLTIHYYVHEIFHASKSVVERHSLENGRESFQYDVRLVGSSSIIAHCAFVGYPNTKGENFRDFKFQLDYLYTQLMKPPYRTQCEDYRDPETYLNSWYYCLLNNTVINGGYSSLVIISGRNNVTRHPKYDMEKTYTAAMKCIKEANIKSPCKSLTSEMTIQPKNSLLLPGLMVIEPKTTVITVFIPKIRPTDFFILLFDQIGFWLGINFVFICFYCCKYSYKIFSPIVKLKKKRVEIAPQLKNEAIKEIADERNMEKYAGRRMNAVKNWRKLAATEDKSRRSLRMMVESNMTRVYNIKNNTVDQDELSHNCEISNDQYVHSLETSIIYSKSRLFHITARKIIESKRNEQNLDTLE